MLAFDYHLMKALSEDRLGSGVVGGEAGLGMVKKLPDWFAALFVYEEGLGSAGGGQRRRTGME